MARKIKLIWDFKGTDALKIATHHEIHLKQFIDLQQYTLKITGCETKTELHAIAYMVVNEEDMIQYRDQLKPHRGEIYTP